MTLRGSPSQDQLFHDATTGIHGLKRGGRSLFIVPKRVAVSPLDATAVKTW